MRRFLVIARNTTFSYKGRAVDARRIGEELGARYIIEGSVRKSGGRVRVTAQLIDGDTGNQIWADRFDRDFDDIFALQDEFTIAIVGAVEPEMGRAEQERVRRKPPGNLDTWDYYQQGMSHLHRRTKEDMEHARGLFEKAIALDPRLGPAHAAYSRTYALNALLGFSDGGRDEALGAARKAVELDRGDAEAHLALGMVHYIDRDFEQALSEMEAAVRLNPSYAAAHHSLGSTLAHSGRSEQALLHLHAAIRLSPNDGEISPFLARIAMALLYLRRHDEALTWARKAVAFPDIQWPGRSVFVATAAHLDRTEEAGRALRELLAFRPGITQTFVRDHLMTIDAEDKEHLIDGLRKAGLPE